MVSEGSFRPSGQGPRQGPTLTISGAELLRDGTIITASSKDEGLGFEGLGRRGFRVSVFLGCRVLGFGGKGGFKLCPSLHR